MAKKKKKNTNYFGDKEEQAVIDYQNATTPEEKNYIYELYLHEPITQLVTGIIRKYRNYIGVCGPEELHERAYLHVFNNLENFKAGRIGKFGVPAKAYSYLGTICHNYCKNHSKDSYKAESHNDDITAYNPDVIESYIEDHYEPDIEEEKIDLVDVIIKEIVNKINSEITANKRLKINEIKTGEGIIMILTNYKEFFVPPIDTPIEYTKKGKMKKQKFTNIYTKNKIFYFLREITGLNSKDLRLALIPFKEMYGKTKNSILFDL